MIAVGDERVGPMPLPLLTQARLAARHLIPLDLTIRRYMAANKTLGQFVLAEAAAMSDSPPELLGSALTAQELVFEQLMAAASEEYRREAGPPLSPEGRLLARICRLLAGEPVDPSPLRYDLGGHHVGLVAGSPDVRPLLKELSTACNGVLLAVKAFEERTWAWLGAREAFDVDLVVAWAGKRWPADVPLGIGECGEGLAGWRRSHRQAREAAGLPRTGGCHLVRYRDFAQVIGAAADPLLRASLREIYLAPLGPPSERAGKHLRRILRAYFAADRNSSSACKALNVTRQTVGSHLGIAQERIGQPLAKCGDALATALVLEELGYYSRPQDSGS